MRREGGMSSGGCRGRAGTNMPIIACPPCSIRHGARRKQWAADKGQEPVLLLPQPSVRGRRHGRRAAPKHAPGQEAGPPACVTASPSTSGIAQCHCARAPHRQRLHRSTRLAAADCTRMRLGVVVVVGGRGGGGGGPCKAGPGRERYFRLTGPRGKGQRCVATTPRRAALCREPRANHLAQARPRTPPLRLMLSHSRRPTACASA